MVLSIYDTVLHTFPLRICLDISGSINVVYKSKNALNDSLPNMLLFFLYAFFQLLFQSLCHFLVRVFKGTHDDIISKCTANVSNADVYASEFSAFSYFSSFLLNVRILDTDGRSNSAANASSVGF